MAEPSSVPSAASLAHQCFEFYRANIDPDVSSDLDWDLEKLAQYFIERAQLESTFIDLLVPWKVFVRKPNKGHRAIADFLITKAAAATLSSNYDLLVETAAHEYGADLTGALDGDEANIDSRIRSPLIKFHGCSSKDRRNTVWAASQLGSEKIKNRIEKTVHWMRANLREKDILIIGFWSDWGYLNETVEHALQGTAPASIIVVDPSETAELEQKAPDLWRVLTTSSGIFEHVRESGDQVLDELRRVFSKLYLGKILRAGKEPFENIVGEACSSDWLVVEELTAEELYSLRRDAEGVGPSTPATLRDPMSSEVLGISHLLLRRKGAVVSGNAYDLDGARIRVLNANGAVLSNFKIKFAEITALQDETIYVAAGAVNLPVPGNLVREGTVGSIIRPAASGEWIDFDEAIRRWA